MDDETLSTMHMFIVETKLLIEAVSTKSLLLCYRLRFACLYFKS